MSTKIILAVDKKEMPEAVSLISSVKSSIDVIKLGMEFFLYNGTRGVNKIRRKFKKPIFLDLKLHDIPNTVAQGVVSLMEKCELSLLTVHLSGGREMLIRANEMVSAKRYEYARGDINLVGVSVMTSISDKTAEEVGIDNVEQQVLKLTKLAQNCGITYIVCSPMEVEMVKSHFPEIKTIVPGIRFDSTSNDDQSRVATPQWAKDVGADYIVVGRAITNAQNPREVAKEIKKICDGG
jgi:orotidine-5'-phosphate decarboxylase